MSLVVCSRRNRAPASKVGIGPHAASWRIQNVIHQMAGATVHRHAFEWPWGDRRTQGFEGIHNSIAGLGIVDVAPVVQEHLELEYSP